VGGGQTPEKSHDMICILSQSFIEGTTEVVLDWLRAWEVPHVRINASDIARAHENSGAVYSISKDGVSVRLKLEGKEIDLSDIKVVWFRRWAYSADVSIPSVFADQSYRSDSNVFFACNHLFKELQAVTKFLISVLSSAKWLSDPKNAAPNKLHVLKTASEAGLDVPDTIITADADELQRFIEKHGAVITKPIGDILMCSFEDREFGTYTSVIDDEFATEHRRYAAFPSLYQEKLEKKYEIRTFYLNGECYSMAMFTQQKVTTQVDFRKYCYEDPNREVPYKLPSSVEASIRKLMDDLRLDTGSIDIVRTTDGRYVFLEVNPVGQFGMVSVPCNYHLERKVARYLADSFYAAA
jgi:ATP-GRASP peptide maturase of grasp-with-spasm system